MDETVFLGTLQDVRDRGEHAFAFVRPSHFWSEAESKWKAIANVAQAFPSRGNLIWLNFPMGVPSQGSLWLFRREENPRQDAINRYCVKDPEEAFEIIDLRQHGDEGARSILTGTGLFLKSRPTSRVYIWYERRSAIGPVSLVSAGRANFWRLDSRTCQMPFEVMEIERDPIAVCVDPGRSLLIMPPYYRPRSTGKKVDWAPDPVVLERAIKILKNFDPKMWKSLDLSERIIEHMVESLHLDDEGDGLARYRLNRACAILNSLRLAKEEAERLTRELCEVPAIAHQLEAVRKTARSEALKAAEDEAAKIREAAQLEAQQIRQEARTEVAVIRAARDQARAELDSLTMEIEHKRAALMEQADALDNEIESRLSDLLSRPERLLADAAILRVASRLWNGAMIEQKAHSALLTDGHDGSSVPRRQPSFPWDDNPDEPALISDEEEFEKTLRAAFKRQGVSRDDAAVLHASLLAGAMPILSGPNAFEVLEAYASVAVGGRLLWLPISPGTLEPGDLFGRSEAVSGQFVPHAGGLLDLLLHAGSTEDLFLVVLDGINRAPVEAYLLPLLGCYADSWREVGGRTLPITHPYMLAPRSPYAVASRLRWPRNVLLAATLVEGVAVLPLPADLWSFATLINVDNTEMRLDGVGHQPKSEVRHVRLATWEYWRQVDMAREDKDSLDEFFQILKEVGLGLSVGVHRSFCRTFVMLRLWYGFDEAVIGAIRLCVVPVAHASGKFEDLLKACEDFDLDAKQLAESSVQKKWLA